MKRTITIILFCLFLGACATSQVPEFKQIEHIVKIEVASVTDSNVKVSDGIVRSMEIPNYEGELSGLSFLCGGKAYLRVFGYISGPDAANAWRDIILMANKGAKELIVYINSPGGSAENGLGLADVLLNARKFFHVTTYVVGACQSAAVPVFAIGQDRVASTGAQFMVHKEKLWKYQTVEDSEALESQQAWLAQIRKRYLQILENNTNLTSEDWFKKIKDTTYFTSDQALEWGLADRIE